MWELPSEATQDPEPLHCFSGERRERTKTEMIPAGTIYACGIFDIMDNYTQI